MFYVRQNATHKVVIGPVVAVGDGFTPVTTLSVSTADEAEVILHDNGTVVDISGYTFAAITTADGYYHLTLQSGITSTIGHVTVVINDDSLCLPVKAEFTVVEEAVYDNFFASSAVGPLTASAVESECNDALVAQKLDHLVAVADADDVVDDSIIAKLANSAATADWSAYVNTTDSLQAIRDRGDSAWTTGGGGSADKFLMVDTTIATLSSQTSFTLTAGSADNDAYNGLTIVIEDASTSTQKAVGVIDDYVGSTKTVTLLNDPGIFTMAATDNVYILAEKAVKPTTDANYHTEQQTGDTFARVGLAGAGLTDLGGMSTGMQGEVNAEVLDVMNVDTFGEPGQGAPAATTTIFAKINYLYKQFRNRKNQTASLWQLYDDAGTTVDQKATVSDDGTTAEKSEIISGP